MPYYYQMDFRIENFADLEQAYKETKPIKGKAGDIRPLGARHKQHYRVVKIDDNTYACRLYETDVATYYRDGRVKLSLGGWDTQTTRGFLERVLPAGWSMFRHNKANHLFQGYNMSWETIRNTANYIMGGNPVYIDTKTNEITGYVTPTKQQVNRQVSKAQRAKYKPFLNFAKTMMEVLQFDVPRPPFNEGTMNIMNTFIKTPEIFSEDRYLEILSVFMYAGWYPRTYNQIKNGLYKAATVYDTIDLPLGSLQGK